MGPAQRSSVSDTFRALPTYVASTLTEPLDRPDATVLAGDAIERVHRPTLCTWT